MKALQKARGVASETIAKTPAPFEHPLNGSEVEAVAPPGLEPGRYCYRGILSRTPGDLTKHEREITADHDTRSDIEAHERPQPWAFAITHLGKTYENRPRRFHYRGPLLIHASKTLRRADCASARAEIEALTGKAPPEAEDIERGGIVGAVMLVDCAEPIAHDDGWRFAGSFGLELEGAISLPFRACRGALGLFKVTLTRSEAAALRSSGMLGQRSGSLSAFGMR